MIETLPALPWPLLKACALFLAVVFGSKLAVHVWAKLRNVLLVLIFATLSATAQTTVEPGSEWTTNLESHLTINNGAESFTLSGSQFVPLKPDGFEVAMWPSGEGSTILGELRAIRLLLETVVQALFLLAGLNAWAIFASNVKV